MILTVPTTPTLVPDASLRVNGRGDGVRVQIVLHRRDAKVSDAALYVANTVNSNCTPLIRPTVVRNRPVSPSKATTQDRASATPSINKARTPAMAVEKASFTNVNST